MKIWGSFRSAFENGHTYLIHPPAWTTDITPGANFSKNARTNVRDTFLKFWDLGMNYSPRSAPRLIGLMDLSPSPFALLIMCCTQLVSFMTGVLIPNCLSLECFLA